MRVLHVNLAGGGIGRYGLLLADALRARSDLQLTSVGRAAADLDEFAAVAGVARHEHELDLAGPLARAAALARLALLVRRVRPDVIHDSAATIGSESVAAWGLPVAAATVLTMHDPQPHAGMARRPHKLLLRRAALSGRHHLIVHGPWCAALAVGAGAPPAALHVVPHGELSAFLRHAGPAAPRRRGRVLVFGGLRPNKGVAWLPEIARRLARESPEAQLVVAGSDNLPPDLRAGAWPARLAQVLAELGALPNVILQVGFIPDRAVGPLFESAELALLPYEQATQSGVALLALPAGAVPVATRVGDLPEVVRDGQTGFLCDPDPVAIARRVAEALADGERLATIRAEGQSVARSQWGWSRIAEQTVAVYTGVIGAR